MWRLVLALACGPLGCRGAEPSASVTKTGTEAGSYEAVIAQLDREIEAMRAIAERDQSWLSFALVSEQLVERARLSGEFEDWLAAEAALDRGFSFAPQGGGPLLERAKLHMALHRVDAAEKDLEKVEAAPLTTADGAAAVSLLRGDLALQRGDLETARERFETAVRAHPNSAVWSRLALLEREAGHPEQALVFWEMAETGDTRKEPPVRAWYALQAGLVELSRERPDVALEHYRRADGLFPGWWLVQEHIAEALAKTGDEEGARTLYRKIVLAHPHPELLDALASLETGPARARLVADARREHEARYASLPDAARGHYVDHLLEFTPDDPELLALARAEVERRPNAEARERLARAESGTKRPPEPRPPG